MSQKISFLDPIFTISLQQNKVKLPNVSYITLYCITVQKTNNFDHISGGYVQKTTQKQPKMVLSAGKKTFQRWKLEKYKSDVS